MSQSSAPGDDRLELAVGRVLRLGINVSSICLAAGLTMTLAGASSDLARRLLTVGMVLLLATPAARVVVSAIDYARQRDWLFVVMTLIVLVELAASVLAAYTLADVG